LVGFIHISDLSDTRVENISDMAIETGMTLPCRISEIDYNRLLVKLTCKTSELSSTKWEDETLSNLEMTEPYFIPENFKQTKTDKPKKKTTIVPRKIEHPFFQNIVSKQAEEYLKTKDIGDVVIRPSSKGVKFLTITWKFYQDIFIHITVREENKPNMRSLGHSLWIGEEKFEDLNEILARYVEPRTAFSQELFEFRNFRHGTQEEIDDMLKERKRDQPHTIPYFFGVSREYPGRFLLSFLPGNRVKHEFITVSSDGFRFRKMTFIDPEKLVKYFKTHWKEPLPSRVREPPVDYGREVVSTTYDAPYANYTPRSSWSDQGRWDNSSTNYHKSSQSTEWTSGSWDKPEENRGNRFNSKRDNNYNNNKSRSNKDHRENNQDTSHSSTQASVWDSRQSNAWENGGGTQSWETATF